MTHRSSIKGNIDRLPLKSGRGKDYKIFTFTSYGSAVEPIIQEFMKNVQTGIRRRVCLIDMEYERRKLYSSTAQPKRNTMKGGGDSVDSFRLGKNNVDSTDKSDLSLALMAIRQCCTQYERDDAILLKERKFNLIDYWMTSLQKTERSGADSLKSDTISTNDTKRRQNKTSRLSVIKEDEVMPKIVCLALIKQPHNVVGQPWKLLKKKFIEDEPINSKIFIIIYGNFSNNFYVDLLEKGEPLQAIVHFLPGENPYELLIPNAKSNLFKSETLAIIEENNYDLRKQSITKPVGVLQQFLPIISKCLAKKYGQLIFDQLTWSFYDIEMLLQQYHEYYVNAFNEINVSLPAGKNLLDTYHQLETLDTDGNYLQSSIPIAASDIISIMLYMDALFNTISETDDVLTDWETTLLSTPLPKEWYATFGDIANTLAEKCKNAFVSITKFKKSERLFVEENNIAFMNLIQYMNSKFFRTIYLACLEYMKERTYLHNSFNHYTYPYEAYNNNDNNFYITEPMKLPRYAKFYMTNDSSVQQLFVLFREYENCKIDIKEIKPKIKLYHFQRNLNEIIESSHMSIIPTCLCFRDFTIFQKDEFLTDLITPEIRNEQNLERENSVERFERVFHTATSYDRKVFIRPKALKTNPIAGFRKSCQFSKTSQIIALDSYDVLISSHLNKINKDYIGLPPGHHLLKGYNLEDIRQEVFVKTSKYFFEEGKVQLYEDRWCFTDTNKNLQLRLHGNQLTLNKRNDHSEFLQPHIRILTNDEVNIRLKMDLNECTKIVLNYPNGLQIFYRDDHTEQIWCCEESPNYEKRRIMTPYGAVIVEYKCEDLIVIMRYNGEIYRLYQYEFIFDENEGEESSMHSIHNASNQINSRKTVANFLNYIKNDENQQMNSLTHHRKTIPNEARPLKTEQIVKNNIHPSSKKKLSQDTNSISIESSNSQIEIVIEDYDEKQIIKNELDFLKNLMDIYKISYKHLIITTSVGRVFNVKQNNDIYEVQSMMNNEWHDYFANESYSAREDGVRMIWGHNYLKCFHNDGTILISDVYDSDILLGDMDEFISDISQSSSHNSIKVSNESLNNNTKKNKKLNKKTQGYESYLSKSGKGEENDITYRFDSGFISISFGNCSIQHTNYACVFFKTILSYDNIEKWMEVKTCNNIHVYKSEKLILKTKKSHTFEEASMETTKDSGAAGDSQNQPFLKASSTSTIVSTVEQEKKSDSSFESIVYGGEENEEEEGLDYRDILRVQINDNYLLIVGENDFELKTLLEHQVAGNIVNDMLTFQYNFNTNINEVFKSIISQIANFKNYIKPKKEEVFFLENMFDVHKYKSLQFIKDLPDLGKYHKYSGNTIVQFSPLKTKMDMFTNTFDWCRTDLAKFPRFQTRAERRMRKINEKLPMVLSVNLFLKIPTALCNTKNIDKFMDPLELINFKKLRHKIKDTMDPFEQPQLNITIKKFLSNSKWKQRHAENARLKLIEAQRMGLYHAMLRHKTYPKYFPFTEKYNGNIQCVDYFDFCLQQCNEDRKELNHKLRVI